MYSQQNNKPNQTKTQFQTEFSLIHVEALMKFYYVMCCIAAMKNFFRQFLLTKRFFMIIISMNKSPKCPTEL